MYQQNYIPFIFQTLAETEVDAQAEREGNEVPTAATVAVAVIRACVPITLVLISVHFAAILSPVGGQLVRWDSSEDVVPAILPVIVFIRTVINQRCEGPRAEATLD